jgi:hypothetical protein
MTYIDRFTVCLALLGVLCFSALTYAERPILAVLPVNVSSVETKALFTQDDISYLSDVIRAEASRILGTQVQILSRIQIEKRLTAKAEECSGAGCFGVFLKTISADYGMQPTIRVADGKLLFTLELANREATLGMREDAELINDNGKNAMIEKTRGLAIELFEQMKLEMGMQIRDQAPVAVAKQIAIPVSEAILAPPVEPVEESMKIKTAKTIAEGKNDEVYRHKQNELHWIAQANAGIASIPETGVGIRVGVQYAEISATIGVGTLMGLLNAFGSLVTPAFNIGYQWGRSRILLGFFRVSFTERITVPSISYAYDIGEASSWGYIIGASLLNSSPFPVVALTYDF